MIRTANLFCKGFEFAASTRGGASSLSASMDLVSSVAGYTTGSTRMGFNYTGFSLDMFSQYAPPSMEETIRLGSIGIGPDAPNKAQALHAVMSAAIVQLTDRQNKQNAAAVGLGSEAAWVGGSAIIGSILLKKAKDGTDKALDAKDRQTSAAASGGMPPEDDEDGKKKREEKDSKNNWNSWQSLPKEVHDGKTYARIGDRLYSQHAVDRMQPSGLGAPAGQIGAGKSIAPRFVEDIIKTGIRRVETNPSGVQRSVIRSGDFEVVTENLDKIIVTVKRIG